MRKFKALLAALAMITVVLVGASPAHAATNLLVGTTFKPDDFDSKLATWSDAALGAGKGIEISRVFWGGTSCPSWSDSRVQKLKRYHVIPFISFKLYSTSCMKTLLDTMPADIPVAYFTHFHEGEADMSADTWKTHQRAMWNIVKNHPLHANGRVKYMSVQTRQWTENNHRSYGLYWCGCGDYFAVDMYANSWSNAYPDPATFLSQSLAFAQSIGYYVFYPELGAIQMPSDPTDAKRAAWIQGIFAQLNYRPRYLGAIWWDAIGTPASDGTQRDFSLAATGANDPCVGAYRKILAAN